MLLFASYLVVTTFTIYGRDVSLIPQVLPQVLRRLWIIYPFVILGVQKKVPPVFQVLAFQVLYYASTMRCVFSFYHRWGHAESHNIERSVGACVRDSS